MVRLFFVETLYEKEIYLTDKLKKYLKENKPKTISLFAAIQFIKLEKLKKEIENLDIIIKTTKAKRTGVEMQILGCDNYHDSFKEPIIEDCDMILYVGDGLFHPKALLLSQIKNKKIKSVVLFDPISNEIKELTKKDIENQIKKTKANIRKFLNSDKIGILVTIKPGQQYFEAAKTLKEKIEKQNKKSYIFIDNTLDLRNLENYPFIECWVNTACPRIGTDDITTINQPMINMREAFDPIKALEDLEN